MANKSFFTNNDLGGQEDLFSMFGIEAPAEAPSSDVDLDDDDGEATEEADEATEKPASPAKKPAKATAKAKPAKKTLTGPVQVIGCGWSATYGDEGKKYSAQEVLKLAFEAGFKEVAAAKVRMVESENTIYCETLSTSASDDDVEVKDGVTVILGQVACLIDAAACGVDADELTLYDVTEKFIELHQEYKGAGLKYSPSAKVAVPVFSDKLDAESLEANTEYTVFGSDGNKELTGSEITSFYKDYVFYKSETGIIFAQPEAPSGKGKPVPVTVTLKPADLGLTEVKEKKAVEKYSMPLEICLGNYNQSIKVTSDDFGGKDKVEKEDILNYLRPQYRAFKSKSRKFDFAYNKATSQLAVMITSGEKGASAGTAEVYSIPGKRVENTPVGVFSGVVKENGDVTSLDFKMKLPRIPYSILAEIIALFRADLGRENIAQVFWNEKDGYYIKQPSYRATKTRVGYSHALDPRKIFKREEVLVMTVHSHNTMKAFFSPVDDRDEDTTGLFGVIGKLDRTVDLAFRAGMEGCFKPLCAATLFGGGAA